MIETFKYALIADKFYSDDCDGHYEDKNADGSCRYYDTLEEAKIALQKYDAWNIVEYDVPASTDRFDLPEKGKTYRYDVLVVSIGKFRFENGEQMDGGPVPGAEWAGEEEPRRYFIVREDK